MAAKIINLLKQNPNKISNVSKYHVLTARQLEEEKLDQLYQEYYSEPDEPDEPDEYAGNCCKCGMPIMDYEPLWQINQMSGCSHFEGDSMVFCENCLLEFIKKKY